MVHISYYDATNGHLKYAGNASGGWNIETVDSGGNVGWYTAIAVDRTGTVHISYYDIANKDLKYAKKASGTWAALTIDSQGDVGRFTSIAVDTARSAHIGYNDFTNSALKYAKLDHAGVWVMETVTSGANVGGYTAIAVERSGIVHMSYHDFVKKSVEYAYKSGIRWKTETIDNQWDVGSFNSIEVGSVNVSYYDATNGDLKFATAPSPSARGGGGGGCFIATAACESGKLENGPKIFLCTMILVVSCGLMIGRKTRHRMSKR